MADIFISYARTDRDRVEPLAAALEAEGYSVWWDRHIAMGEDFGKDIEKALTEAKAVIVCWSEEARGSHWVRDEASHARDKHILVPIRLDDSQPPLGFRQFQAADFSDWPQSRPGWNLLLTNLARIVGGEHAAPDAAPDDVQAAKAKPRTAVLLGAILALLIVATAGWFLFAGAAGDEAQAADRPSIAVLPFRALSSGEDDAFFAEGVTEELTNRLSALDDLLVISANSAAFFRGKDVSLDEMAEQLGADYLVEGSIRHAAPRVRVSARLSNAETGESLWSNDYDTTVEDVLAVQSDVSIKVAEALDILLDEEKRAAMEAVGVSDPEAWVEYAKGNDLYDRLHAEARFDDLHMANTHYLRAFELAPNLWQAPYGAMDYHGHNILDHAQNFDDSGQPVFDDGPSITLERSLERLQELARMADRAHPDGFAPQARLPAVLASDDWSTLGELLDAYRKSDCPVASWASNFALPYGNAKSFGQTIERIRECDKLRGTAWSEIANYELIAGDPQRALAANDRDIALRGSSAVNEYERVLILLKLGQADDARAVAARIPTDTWAYYAAQRIVDLVTGKRGKPPLPDDEIVSPYEKIIVHNLMGDSATANRIAAMMDARVGGPFALALIGNDCLCGAAFDIDVTPNFKRQLAQAGLNWPPADPLGIQQKLRAR